MKRRRNGYVLLLTLVLLALAATAMTGVCLRSFNKAIDASQAQSELQRRWAAISCRAMFLPHVEEILKQHERITQQSCPIRRQEVTLGGDRFVLVFADEGAKINVRTIYREVGVEQTQRCLEQLLPRASANEPLIRLAPSQVGDLTSFSQIFDRDDPRGHIAATKSITLWGGGRASFRRASAETLTALNALGLENAQDLVRIRASDPTATLESAMNTLNWHADTRELARRLLMDDTHCHSLWIVPQDKSGGKSGGRGQGGEWFCVEEKSPDATNWTFTW